MLVHKSCVGPISISTLRLLEFLVKMPLTINSYVLLFFLLVGLYGTYLLRFINSGKLLLQFALMAAVCVLGTVLIEGIVGLYALVGISFFMSVMFPTIYGIALEDLDEKESKIGAAALVMAIVGGANAKATGNDY